VSADLYSMETLLEHPDVVLDQLVAEDAPIYGVRGGKVLLADHNGVVIELTFTPWKPCAEAGFPNERVRILVTASRRVFVVPQNADGRRWKHRMPQIELGDLGELCLWYSKDAAALVWLWEDGLLDLLTITHRHLQYEEFWRRNREWPVEDAPHGNGKHAVVTPHLRTMMQEWART
jgi:hypothetical protein